MVRRLPARRASHERRRRGRGSVSGRACGPAVQQPAAGERTRSPAPTGSSGPARRTAAATPARALASALHCVLQRRAGRAGPGGLLAQRDRPQRPTACERVRATLARRAASRERCPAGARAVAAIVRCPAPSVLSSNARPNTSAPSRRRGTDHDGSSACVRAHGEQRVRRGRTRRTMPVQHTHLALARVTPRRQRPATARTADSAGGQPLLELLLADQHRRCQTRPSKSTIRKPCTPARAREGGVRVERTTRDRTGARPGYTPILGLHAEAQ